ncbi:MAG: sigma-70 family RNA polymerase sigma factor [Candidatus Poribacteria bacterium]|nr:sigma-70 family RNA polymerase sigma factor [Candidatus Poribacteria bacterium]
MKHDDAELIERTLEGDQQAFTALVEKYQEQIHALAWQKIGDFHIAQEITQDAFITAYQKLATLTHHNRFAGWLYVITSNKCNMWHRKKKPKLQSLEETDPMELEEVYYSEYTSRQREEAANQNRRTIVRKLFNKLRESERTVVTMHYLAGLTCEEIGRFLGVSPNTVKSRLHRAREKLKKEEAVIQENLSSFQLPTQLTENIMKGISQLKPTAPSGSKPLVPLAISAASAITVFLFIGFGAQNLIRFQKPYSLEATSKPTIEIVDAPIVLESTAKPAVNNQVGRSEVLSNNDGTGQKPDTPLFAAAQSDNTEISKSKMKWRQTNGPYGGNIRTLFATSDGILFAGIGNQGIYRSTDLGDSWAPANTGFYYVHEGHKIYLSAFAQKGNTIYAGVRSPATLYIATLYMSTDTGKTWSHVATHLQNTIITGIVTVDNRIYISTSPNGRGVGGVWYTDDEKSWIPMNDGLKDLRIREFTNIGTTLVVGTENGAFRKKVTENSWHPIHSGFTKQLSSSGIRIDSIAVMDNLLYMGVNMGKDGEDGGLFRSDDEGDSWTRITAKEMQRSLGALAVFKSTLFASTRGSVFRSDDKGDSWVPVSKGIIDKVGSGLVVISTDTVFVNTTHQKPWLRINESENRHTIVFMPTFEGTIYRTTDGGNSWVEANIGIMETSVVDLEVVGNRIYALTDNRLFYSADGGETWERIEISPKMSEFRFAKISALNGKLYVGAARYSRSNGGLVGGVFQLDERNNSLIEVKTDREMYAIVSMHIVGTAFYVGTTHGQGVFLWNEGWNSWLNLGLEDQGIDILEISVGETNVYAKTQHGKIYCLQDHQGPWELIKDTKAYREAHRRFAESRKIDNKHYVLSAREGLIRSIDGGNSWTQLNAGIEDMSIATVEIDGNEFYLSTSQNKIYKWSHKDERWVQLGSLSRSVQSLAVLDGFLYAGTQAGVHRIQIEK